MTKSTPSFLRLLVSVMAISCSLVCRAASADTSQIHVNDVLSAIRAVESRGRYDCPPGRHGEQGAYQFRRSVWRQHTSESFALARTTEADAVARRHYVWIVGELTANGVEPNTWNVAAAWNAGLSAVVRGTLRARHRDYANRVVNLVGADEQLRKRLTPVFTIASN